MCLASIAADRVIGMAGMFCAVPFGLIPAWNILARQHQLNAMPPLAAKITDFIRQRFIHFPSGSNNLAALTSPCTHWAT
ncbi:MAG: hypothetical protein U0V48_11640 [Anaerolineales bacterium]